MTISRDLYHTTDGGTTWEENQCYHVSNPTLAQIICELPDGGGSGIPTLYDVAFLDSSGEPSAITGGYGGELMAFEDKVSTNHANYDKCDCTAVEPEECYDDPQVWVEYSSSNYGENWCSQDPAIYGVSRISDTTACLVGAFGRIAMFDYATSSVVDRATFCFNRLIDAAFIDSDLGFVIGQKYQIFLTSNGGGTWRNVSDSSWECGGENEATAEGRGIDMSPAGTFAAGKYGLAVGTSGFVARSTLFGDSWTRLSEPAIPHGLDALNAVAFVSGSDTTAYAVGASGTVIKSTNSGATWIFRSVSGGAELNGLSFVDANHGYAVGADGHIYSTASGGVAWSSSGFQGTAPTNAFNDIAAWGSWGSLGAAAIAVGEGGMIYAKGASDRTFSQVTAAPTVTVHLRDVEVLNSGTYVRICGDSGVVLFRDSGTWSMPKSQTTWPLYKMAFQSASEGKAIGRPFVVLDYH